jgi:curved DNA-binding protein CbpA
VAVTEGLYERLAVDARASHEQIVAAYRRLAHSVHPDAHPEDPDAARRFREITEAYEVLIDPARRAGYDEACRNSLRAPVRPAEPRPGAHRPLIIDLGPLPARQQQAPMRLAVSADTGDAGRCPGGDPFGVLTRLL